MATSSTPDLAPAPAPSPTSSTATSSTSSTTATSSTSSTTTRSNPSSTTSTPSSSTSVQSSLQFSSTTTLSPATSQSVSGTPAPVKTGSSQNLSPGAVAGVAIACTILGAALAIVLMMLLRRKQSKSSSKHRTINSHRMHKSVRAEKPAPVAIPASKNASTSIQPPVTIENFLPQQADDDTVMQKILVLFDQIELHVDNFYGEYSEKLSIEQEGELSRYGSPTLTTPLAALLETSHRKTAIVKHCLGFYVLNSISSPASPDNLLPDEISALLALTHTQSERSLSDNNYSLALSRWRMLTAYLVPGIFNGSAMKSPNYDSRIYEAASKFSHTFTPLSQPQHDHQRVKHLAEVFRTAVRLALWLYSQPSAFKLDWGSISDGEGSSRTVVTVPSVLKSHDEYGARINPPLILQPLVKKRV